MIGLSALRWPADNAEAASQQRKQQHKQQHKPHPTSSLAMLKQQQLHEAAFVPMQACEVDWELPAGQVLLVPCTYAPGVTGSFTLSVTTTSSGCAGGFSCQPVPGGLAGLLAATGSTALMQH